MRNVANLLPIHHRKFALQIAEMSKNQSGGIKFRHFQPSATKIDSFSISAFGIATMLQSLKSEISAAAVAFHE
jgi:hypothetical protein